MASGCHINKPIENMGKKYELTDETIEHNGITLRRIKALIDIPCVVEAGDLGGWVESEQNLSQDGKCWIHDNAKVYDDAEVHDNAEVRDNAEVYDRASVCGNARVYGNAEVHNSANVYDSAWVYEHASIYDCAVVHGNTRVYGNARVSVDASVYGDSRVYGNAEVFGEARVYGNAVVYEDANVFGKSKVYDNAKVYGDAWVYENAVIYGNAEVYENSKVHGATSVGRCTKVHGTANVYKRYEVRGDITECNLSNVQCEVAADSHKAEVMSDAAHTGDSTTRLIFKRLRYTESSHPSEFSLDMMYHVNKGWEVAHIESDMVVYRKAVPVAEYKEYYNSLADKIDKWNNISVD